MWAKGNIWFIPHLVFLCAYPASTHSASPFTVAHQQCHWKSCSPMHAHKIHYRAQTSWYETQRRLINYLRGVRCERSRSAGTTFSLAFMIKCWISTNHNRFLLSLKCDWLRELHGDYNYACLGPQIVASQDKNKARCRRHFGVVFCRTCAGGLHKWINSLYFSWLTFCLFEDLEWALF